MHKLSLKVLALATALTATGAVLAGNTEDEQTLKEIAGYRQWTRVTEKPVQVILDSRALV
jgi:hypothetical protein